MASAARTRCCGSSALLALLVLALATGAAAADPAVSVTGSATAGAGHDSDVYGGASFERGGQRAAPSALLLIAPELAVTLLRGRHALILGDSLDVRITDDEGTLLVHEPGLSWRYRRPARRLGGVRFEAGAGVDLAWLHGGAEDDARYFEGGGHLAAELGRGRLSVALRAEAAKRRYASTAEVGVRGGEARLGYRLGPRLAAGLGYGQSALSFGSESSARRHMGSADLSWTPSPRLRLGAVVTAGADVVTVPLGGPVARTHTDPLARVAASAAYQASARLQVFAAASYLHVAGEEDDGYRRALVLVGVRARLERAPSAARPPPPPPANEDGRQPITFEIQAADARVVAVIGEFNDWDPEQGRLQGPDEAGRWRLTVPVPPGRWRYNYLVDDEVVTPQDAEATVDDGFGGTSAVLWVR
jgi:hypothetical protein